MHYVYIITNRSHSTLYIGTTRALIHRMKQHKNKEIFGFSARYNLNKLVYYEKYPLPMEAITREKRLKNWKRVWKNELIDKQNPAWKDLFADLQEE